MVSLLLLQRILPDNTKHSYETDIHAPARDSKPQTQQADVRDRTAPRIGARKFRHRKYISSGQPCEQYCCKSSADRKKKPILCTDNVHFITLDYGPEIETRWERDFPHQFIQAPGAHSSSCKIGTWFCSPE